MHANTMKAFRVEKYGQTDLHAAQVAVPSIGPQDVLIQVAAASINPLDSMLRRGALRQMLTYQTPFVLGHDLAGTVMEVGAAVRDYQVGDEVYARPRDHRIGTFAEYIAVDQADIARKPATLSMAESAALPLVALTSWQILVVLAKVQPGHKVLVHAGAGGLGSTVIQIAKYLGAYVATTVSTKHVARVEALGADEVIDYTTTQFSDRLSGFDVVLDAVGGDTLLQSLQVLKPGGLAVSVVGPPDIAFATQMGQPLLKPVMWLLSWRIRQKARKMGVRYRFFFMQANGAQLATLAALYDAGTLKPVLDRTFSFDALLEAMHYVEQGRARGKVVVVMPTTSAL